MPYIPQDDRVKFEMIVRKMELNAPENKGELNFLISTLLNVYVHQKGYESYQILSDAISAATDAAEEFRRRRMNPYEEEKIKLNGDI